MSDTDSGQKTGQKTGQAGQEVALAEQQQRQRLFANMREDIQVVRAIASRMGDYKEAQWTDEKIVALVVWAETGCEAQAKAASGLSHFRFKSMKQNPTFCRVFRQLLRGDIETAGLALAVRTLKDVMSDTGAPAAARVSAAKTMREWADSSSAATEAAMKNLQDMSVSDLAAIIDKLEAAGRESERTIDVTPAENGHS